MIKEDTFDPNASKVILPGFTTFFKDASPILKTVKDPLAPKIDVSDKRVLFVLVDQNYSENRGFLMDDPKYSAYPQEG